jgi:hypothetical protein
MFCSDPPPLPVVVTTRQGKKTTNERYPVEQGGRGYLQRDEIAAVGEHLFEYLLFPVFVFEVARGTVVEEFGHGVFLGQHVVAQHSHRVCARQGEKSGG